jgi:predicted enzyme related to lactoylglutathione lyase
MNDPTVADKGQATRLRHVLCPASDIEQAVRFYTEGLGLTVAFQDGGRFAALDSGSGVALALTAGDEDVTGAVAASFKVADTGEAVRRLVSAGATLVRGPEEGPHETRAVLRDPSGNPFVIYAPASP